MPDRVPPTNIPRFPPRDPQHDPPAAGGAIPGRGQLALMAVVLTAALIIAVYGVLGLILNRDVIQEPDAGPLVGPFMAVTVCGVVLWFVRRSRTVHVLRRAAASFLTAVVAGPLVGAIAYAGVRAEIFVIPVFFGRYVVSPFVLASGVIAGLVVLSYTLIEQSRPGAASSG